jgi:hypothetical protein
MWGLQVIVSIHRRYRLIYDRAKLYSEIQLNVEGVTNVNDLEPAFGRFRSGYAIMRIEVDRISAPFSQVWETVNQSSHPDSPS